jgi:hypothetical protein
VVKTVLFALLGAAVILAVAAFEGAAAMTVAACATTDATTVLSPVTGILVKADDLLGPHNCGESSDDVYKYAAVLVDSTTGQLITAQVYDCFADAVFVNLTGTSTEAGVVYDYNIFIYAWTMQSYTANYALSAPGGGIAEALTAINAAGATDAALTANPFVNVVSTYTTTCTASQMTNIEQTAVCNPLTPSPATPPMPESGSPAQPESGAAPLPESGADAESLKDGEVDSGTTD